MPCSLPPCLRQGQTAIEPFEVAAVLVGAQAMRSSNSFDLGLYADDEGAWFHGRWSVWFRIASLVYIVAESPYQSPPLEMERLSLVFERPVTSSQNDKAVRPEQPSERVLPRFQWADRAGFQRSRSSPPPRSGGYVFSASAQGPALAGKRRLGDRGDANAYIRKANIFSFLFMSLCAT